jgi:hypothetical protein
MSAISARLLGHYDEAERAVQSALVMSERLQSPFWVAMTKLERARLQADRGDDPDVLLRDVLSVASAHGYGALERWAIDRGRSTP